MIRFESLLPEIISDMHEISRMAYLQTMPEMSQKNGITRIKILSMQNAVSLIHAPLIKVVNAHLETLYQMQMAEST